MSISSYSDSEKIWRGLDENPMYSSTVSLGQILLTSLSENASQVGQICHENGSEMLNAEIRQHAIRVALNLKDLGLQEGDVIGLAAKNSQYIAPVVIGALVMGTPVSTLDPLFKKDDIVHMFHITRPKIVICEQENYEEMKKALEELSLVSQVYIFSETADIPQEGAKFVTELLTIHTGEETFVPPVITNGSILPAIIVCSSGTTGPPKGVSLSHSNVLYQMIRGLTEEKGRDRFFCFSSLYWLSGIITLVSTTFMNIIRVITVRQFSPELLVEIIRKHRITAVLTPPLQLATTLQWKGLCSKDLDSMNTWYVGGGHVPEGNCIQMNKYLRNGSVSIAYGCSEVGLATILKTKNYKSVGQMTNGISLKIIDAKGEHLGPGERGEICLKSCQPICGYFKNEEANKKSLIGGWFHTGDVGFLDDDGDLYIVDRIKDMFKMGNYHINPSEIEKVIEKIPGVVAVSVFGIPDPVYTEVVTAVVVKSKDSTLSEGDVSSFVENDLPSYKWLRGGVHFVDKMPVTPSGKILKRICREMVMEKSS